MPQAIIRMYETESQGSKAAAELREAGFEHVFKFAYARGKGVAAAKARASLVDEMTAAHIWRSHAESYASELEDGGSLVAVTPPFGAGLTATRILDSHAPIGKGLETRDDGGEMEWDEAAPLSSLLQLPVLIRTDHPMETLSGIPSLTKGSGFLSSLLGLPLLSRGRHNATSSFGIPLLKSGPAHKTSSMGLPLLSNSPTPLSSLFGLRVLK
jgi:hypothetical protein